MDIEINGVMDEYMDGWMYIWMDSSTDGCRYIWMEG